MADARRAARQPKQPPDRDAALDVAARFLATRPRTRWEVERRLHRAGADTDVVAATLDRLVQMGLLDDVAFARWWAEQRDRHAPRGRRMVEAELRQHGVPREVLEAMRGDELSDPVLDAEGLPATEDQRADAALERHLRGRPLPDDGRALQRVGMFLVRRGFAPDVARSAIRRRQEGG
jgi:regulatory protein